MFSDPQSITVNAVAQSLPRTGTSLNASQYKKDDGSYVLSVSHSTGRRNQHRVRIDGSKIVVDPLATDRNLPVSMSAYLVVDVPLAGYSVTEMAQLITALADWLKASTNTAKLVGGEI